MCLHSTGEKRHNKLALPPADLRAQVSPCFKRWINATLIKVVGRGVRVTTTTSAPAAGATARNGSPIILRATRRA